MFTGSSLVTISGRRGAATLSQRTEPCQIGPASCRFRCVSEPYGDRQDAGPTLASEPPLNTGPVQLNDCVSPDFLIDLLVLAPYNEHVPYPAPAAVEHRCHVFTDRPAPARSSPYRRAPSNLGGLGFAERPPSLR